MSDGYHMGDEVQRRSIDLRIMRRLLVYIRPYWGRMLLATALLLGAAVLGNLNPTLIMWAIDAHIVNPERVAAAGADAAQLQQAVAQDRQGLRMLTLVLALLLLGELLLRWAQLIIVAFVGQTTMLKMRMEIFAHLQEMSLRFLDRNPVGRLMTRVTNDVEKIQQTIVTGVVQVVSDCMTLVVVLVFMLFIDWQLTLAALLPSPLIVAVTMSFRRHAHHSFLEIQRKIARVNAYLQENVSGMRVIQLFCREGAHYEEYRLRNEDHCAEWIRQVRNYAMYFPAVELLGSLSLSLIVVWCGERILHTVSAMQGVEAGQASYGAMFAFVLLADRFFGPIRSLADRYNLLLEAMASSERVFALLDTEPDIQDVPGAKSCEQLTGQVDFEQVWFSYGAGAQSAEAAEPDWVLKNISLSIAPGERVAIVGHTGAGKSTIIGLLSRFYDVQRGTIRVDGVDVRDYAQVALRRRIGVVLQDVFLFSGTVEDNIRLGNADMSPEWVRACAEYVNASKFIDKLPGRYQYHVGERGNNLSTGQRQLLAFARTLAHNPDILVLDEATSSIDTETEALIQDAIAKLMAERTSIVIAHRLSTVQHADRIVVMHHGEIRETGTHQELLAKGGLYRTLYELQYKGQESMR